jgi:hypothetical protein
VHRDSQFPPDGATSETPWAIPLKLSNALRIYERIFWRGFVGTLMTSCALPLRELLLEAPNELLTEAEMSSDPDHVDPDGMANLQASHDNDPEESNTLMEAEFYTSPEMRLSREFIGGIHMPVHNQICPVFVDRKRGNPIE